MHAGLCANSIAALGVLKAAWRHMPYGRLPDGRRYSTHRHYNEAIVRHSEVGALLIPLHEPLRENGCLVVCTRLVDMPVHSVVRTGMPSRHSGYIAATVRAAGRHPLPAEGQFLGFQLPQAVVAGIAAAK